jgi:hypothetical protein
MKLIAHRGYWLNSNEKNSITAFKRALVHGFGIETDLRDFNGKLVVSHDIPNENAVSIEDFIQVLTREKTQSPIALNIKSDGLYDLVKTFLDASAIENAFVFDMSVPDMLGYFRFGITTYTRLSEYEKHAAFLNRCEGVWLDAFEDEWYDKSLIENILENSKKISFVSPELHGRDYKKLWEFLIENKLHRNKNIFLCTDFPLEAKEYFDV